MQLSKNHKTTVIITSRLLLNLTLGVLNISLLFSVTLYCIVCLSLFLSLLHCFNARGKEKSHFHQVKLGWAVLSVGEGLALTGASLEWLIAAGLRPGLFCLQWGAGWRAGLISTALITPEKPWVGHFSWARREGVLLWHTSSLYD